MKQNAMLTIASLLSILFMTFHLTDDIVRMFEKGGSQTSLLCPSLSFGCTNAGAQSCSAMSRFRFPPIPLLTAQPTPHLHYGPDGKDWQ